MPKLERLAQELETIHDRQGELKPLIDKVRDDTADRDLLFQEMIHYKLGFFAYKLKEGYYDQNPLDTETKAGVEEKPEAPKPAEEVKTPPTEEVKPEEPKVQDEVKPAEPEPQKPKPGMTTTESLSLEPDKPVPVDPNELPDCAACLGHKAPTKQHPEQV